VFAAQAERIMFRMLQSLGREPVVSVSAMPEKDHCAGNATHSRRRHSGIRPSAPVAADTYTDDLHVASHSGLQS
jgi:hypothetical protein